jgi:nitronate monooxygenase
MKFTRRRFLDRLGIDLPIIQAPMAGIASPAMAGEVSAAGALGSIAIGASTAVGARAMIASARERSSRTLNVNVFCHRPARADPAREQAWIARFAPEFTRLGATPPAALSEIYKSFLADDAMLAMLLEERPRVVSFHFGLPQPEKIAALKSAGIVLLATVTNLAEARAAEAAGVDALVAQGYEAGGHRGSFDPAAPDDRLGTMALVRILANGGKLPVIAAGGIMDGAGISAALKLGAVAAQLGTAFIACDESLADEAYRSALFSDAANHTIMTRAISGRPARSLPNHLTAAGQNVSESEIPAYPIAYDLGKALHAAAKARAEHGFGAPWAGQGAPLARAMPVAALIRVLTNEMAEGWEGFFFF